MIHMDGGKHTRHITKPNINANSTKILMDKYNLMDRGAFNPLYVERTAGHVTIVRI